MRDNDPNPSRPVSGANNPKLRAFLRQAHAVIAAERGLNSRSRMKLKSLAGHLNLPEDLFEQAIDLLQQTDSQELSHWERAFVEELDKRLKPLAGRILSYPAEEKIVLRGQSKHQLSELRARQLVANQAEELSVSRVSLEDAEDYVVKLVRDQIKSQLTIEPEAREKLYESAHDWGVDRGQVDQAILTVLFRNRNAVGPRRKLLAGLAALLLVVGCISIAVFAYDKFSNGINASNEPEPVLDREVENDIQPATADVDSDIGVSWIGETEKREIHNIGLEHSALADPLNRIFHSKASQRKQAYSALIHEICLGDKSHQESAKGVLNKFFYKETDAELAEHIVSATQQYLLSKDNPLVQTKNQTESNYRANDLLATLRFSSVGDAEDVERLLMVSDALGISTEGMDLKEYLEESESRIARDQWNQVLKHSWSSPQQAANLVGPLYEQTKSRVDRTALNQFRIRALLSILQTDEKTWETLRASLEDSVATGDEVKVHEFTRIFLNSRNQPFRDFFGPVLVNKLQPENSLASRSEITRELTKFRDRFQYRTFEPLLSRNDNVDDWVRGLMAETTMQQDMDAQTIAQMSFVSNASISISLLARSSSSDYVDHDQSFSKGTPVLHSAIKLPSAGTLDQTPTSIPTASDNRRKTELIARLTDTHTNPGYRTSIFASLAEIANRFEDLTYGESHDLAGYLLSEMPIDEWLNIEKNLPQVRHWPTLPIALADRLPESEVKIDQAVTIATLLFGQPYELGSADEWRKDMKERFYKLTVEKLERMLQQNPPREVTDWNRLPTYLAAIYQQRASLISAEADADFPGLRIDYELKVRDQAVRCLNALISRSAQADTSKYYEAMRLIENCQFSDLEFVFRINQLQIELLGGQLSQEFPDASFEVHDILSEFESAAARKSSMGSRLFLTELTWLKLCDFERKKTIQRKLERN